MINQKREICKACALGNEKKYSHNGDLKSCIKGRKEYLKLLPEKEQIRQLIIGERLSKEMAEYICHLSKERKKTALDVLEEEGLEI
jgi:hypothetical protein